MKRLLTIFFAALIVLTMAACQRNQDAPEEITAQEEATEQPEEQLEDEQETPDTQEAASTLGLPHLQLPPVEMPPDAQPHEMLSIAAAALAEALAEAGSHETRTAANLVMTSEGVNVDMLIHLTMAMMNRDEGDADFKMSMITRFMGMEIPMTVYYRDGIAYMDMFGSQGQRPMPLADALAQFSNAQEMLMDPAAFSADMVLDQHMREVSEGTELIFTLDTAGMGEHMAQAANIFGMAADLGDGTVEVTNTNMSVVLDDTNNIRSIYIFFAIDVDDGDEQIRVNLDVESSFVRIGGVVIDFPDALDEFPSSE
ncbi:MAG: hypothetical protein FWD96_05910 [Defluviitaleaceae bacterium]|nr:hypothetical protein [Defluviitaleaceae bacterium]